ncbi:MAG: hypothetical protein K2J67_00585 [Lachnospiraceae bacterium]|nr:hypothetical protein [Lachnospiraceae bacterium]
MKKTSIKLLAVIMAAAVTVGSIFGKGSLSVKAADTDQIVKANIQVTYGQTEARSMLDAMNGFRQGNEAWVWDENDADKITYQDLGALSIDPVLERIAMLRAVEIALAFSHTRPNGQSCFTAYRDDIKGNIAENIAAGYSSAEDAFRGWQETDQPYSGQGHRRNMLGSVYVSVGIGHVIYQGTHYWVQEFSNKRSGEDLTEASDSTVVEEIDMLYGNIQNIQLNKTAYSLTVGETVSLDDLKVSADVTGHWPSRACSLENDGSFTVADNRIALVENGVLSAKSAGSTILAVTVLEQTIRIPITIEESSVNPTETMDPSASSQPKETVNPSASSQPKETGNPSASSQPKETGDPSASSRPDETEDPSVSAQPNVTKDPSVVDTPRESQEPDATRVPAGTQVPDGSRPNPVVTQNPAGSDKTNESIQTGNPLQGKKVTGIKVKQKKKTKKLTIRFQKLKKAHGYQITYAWNKKFTNHRKVKYTKSASAVLSGLKHKKVYYIKVRAYILDQNGRKRYSADSKIVKRRMK